MDERGLLTIGAADSFVVYSLLHGEPLFRFARRDALPLRFARLVMVGALVVALEAKGVRFFHALAVSAVAASSPYACRSSSAALA